MKHSAFVAFLFLSGICTCGSFYLPGVAPREFSRSEKVKVKAEQLSSVVTQLPLEYYSLPFCGSHTEIVSKPLNLGELFHGSRIHNTPYEFIVGHNEQCKILCIQEYDTAQIEDFSVVVQTEYRVNMLLDSLPLATKWFVAEQGGQSPATKRYDLGFKVGEVIQSLNEAVALNNHLRFTVLYHVNEDFEGFRIVGFEVEPFSIKHETARSSPWGAQDCVGLEAGSRPECSLLTCSPETAVSEVPDAEKMLLIASRGQVGVIWTYDVIWKPSPIRWASRWDTYLDMHEDEVHWFAVLNSLCVVVFLSGFVGYILARALKSDVARYTEVHEEEMFPVHERSVLTTVGTDAPLDTVIN